MQIVEVLSHQCYFLASLSFLWDYLDQLSTALVKIYMPRIGLAVLKDGSKIFVPFPNDVGVLVPKHPR